MAPLFLVLHAVFVLVTALVGEYVFAAVFALLGVYFFVAFHPSFFRLPSAVIATQSERLRTGTRHIVPHLVGWLRQYSLSVTFVFFYAGTFGVTYSLGWFSYDVAAMAVSVALFSLSWYLRRRSAPVVEEFFRTNTLLFSLGYGASFAFYAFTGHWSLDVEFFVNIVLCIASFAFVVFAQPSLSAPSRRAFFAGMLAFSAASAAFVAVDILVLTGMLSTLADIGASAWTVALAALLACAVLSAFVLPRVPVFTPYSGVALVVAESLFLLSVVGLSVVFLWSERQFVSGLLLSAYCLAALAYLRSRQSQAMLVAVYAAVSELFLSLALPSLSDPSGFVAAGFGTAFVDYAFPLFSVFSLPSMALAVTYAFALPRYYSFSLVLYAVAYSVPVFLYLVTRYFDRFFTSLFLSVSGICFFVLFLFVSLRISADRRLDRSK